MKRKRNTEFSMDYQQGLNLSKLLMIAGLAILIVTAISPYIKKPVTNHGEAGQTNTKKN
ncbi:hypothetical protein LC593_10500 [Nostoc sp. CHAB 5844]|nr:hypothetical protein [Nostoc sp. CHAB 5844]